MEFNQSHPSAARIWLFVGFPALIAIVAAAGLRGDLAWVTSEDPRRIEEDRWAPADAAMADESQHGNTEDSWAKARNTLENGGYLPGMQHKDYATLEHDTPFRKDEREPWYRSLAALRDTDESMLSELSVGPLTPLQLARQPRAYQGKILEVQGTLRRVGWRPASPNLFGITGTWQGWLKPDHSDDPIVIYFLELPPGFPLDEGDALHETVVCTGMFFKRWAYMANGGLRSAPVVLARTCLRYQPTPTSAPSDPVTWLPAVVGIAVLIAAVVVGWISRQPRGTKKSLPPATFLAVFISGWLTAAPGMACGQSPPQPTAASAAVENTVTADAYLATLGFSEDTWRELGDGDLEDPTTRRLAHQVGWLLGRIAEESPGEIPPGAGAESSSLSQGEFVRLEGVVTSLRRSASGDATIYELALIETPTETKPFAPQANTAPSKLVWVLHPPRAWERALGSQTELALQERVRLVGIRVPRGSDGDAGAGAGENSELVPPRVVAATLAWHPFAPDPRWPTSADQCLLATHGLDLTALDAVVSRSPLVASDREGFYQLLATVPRVPAEELRNVSGPATVLSDLLRDPTRFTGRVLTFTGIARRAVRIEVEDPDIRRRFGMETYVEVELFVDPDVILQVSHPETGETKRFSTFPVVFCCRDWPRGLPMGESLHLPLTITGAYLKLWSYHSRFLDQGWSEGGRPLMQFSPLLLANAPVSAPTPEVAMPSIAGLVATVIVGGVVLGWCVVWWTRRRDRLRPSSRSDIDMSFLSDPPPH